MRPYYQDEAVTIYHGDCREILPVLEPVDLVLTSPPYANQRDYDGRYGGEWAETVALPLSGVRVSDDGQILVNLGLVHRDGEVHCYWNLLIEAFQRQAYRLFGWYTWDQSFGLPGDWNGRFAPSHEWIFHFNRQACELKKFVPCQERLGVVNGSGLRRADGTTADAMSGNGKPYGTHKIPDSVIRICREASRVGEEAEHPARFPVDLPMFLIQAFPCQTVLDPFMGSGTTIYAAKQLGIKAIGIDFNERYCEIAAKRCAQGVLNFA